LQTFALFLVPFKKFVKINSDTSVGINQTIKYNFNYFAAFIFYIIDNEDYTIVFTVGLASWISKNSRY